MQKKIDKRRIMRGKILFIIDNLSLQGFRVHKKINYLQA